MWAAVSQNLFVLLALLVLGMGVKMGINLITPPEEIYQLAIYQK